MAKDLQPVPGNAIEVGKPLPWAIYDRSGQLMAREGQLVASRTQQEALQQRGMYRNRLWTPQAANQKNRIESSLHLMPDIIDDRPTPADNKQDQQAGFENGERRERYGADAREVAYKSLKFVIGTPLQIRASDSAQFSVRLIGHHDNHAIFTSVPSGNGGMVMLREGQPCQFRSFLGRHICLFSAPVIKTPLTPFPHVLFAMPDTATIMAVRNANRLRLTMIGSTSNMDVSETGKKTPCNILDLSSSGALIETGSPLGSTGNRIGIFFRLAVMGSDSYLKLQARIRSCRNPDDGHTRHQYGIQFENSSLQDKLILENFVLTRLADIQA